MTSHATSIMPFHPAVKGQDADVGAAAGQKIKKIIKRRTKLPDIGGKQDNIIATSSFIEYHKLSQAALKTSNIVVPLFAISTATTSSCSARGSGGGAHVAAKQNKREQQDQHANLVIRIKKRQADAAIDSVDAERNCKRVKFPGDAGKLCVSEPVRQRQSLFLDIARPSSFASDKERLEFIASMPVSQLRPKINK